MIYTWHMGQSPLVQAGQTLEELLAAAAQPTLDFCQKLVVTLDNKLKVSPIQLTISIIC